MRARIYQPSRNAMTSGTARTRNWVVEVERSERRDIDPLMGWIGSGDTAAQVRLSFPTREAAVAYARQNGLEFVVVDPHKRRPAIRPGGYGENFATARREPWTH